MCSICREVGLVQQDIYKCKMGSCGHYMHHKCLKAIEAAGQYLKIFKYALAPCALVLVSTRQVNVVSDSYHSAPIVSCFWQCAVKRPSHIERYLHGPGTAHCAELDPQHTLQGGPQCSKDGRGRIGVHMPLPLLPGLPHLWRCHEDDALLALPPGIPLQVRLPCLAKAHGNFRTKSHPPATHVLQARPSQGSYEIYLHVLMQARERAGNWLASEGMHASTAARSELA